MAALCLSAGFALTMAEASPSCPSCCTQLAASLRRGSVRRKLASRPLAQAASRSALPTQPSAEPPVSEAPPKPERGGGYHVTDHVKRYYQSTLV